MKMQQFRRFAVAAFIALSVAGFVGCGGKPTVSTTTSTRSSALAVTAAPSISAKMICEQEAANEVAAVIGIKTTKPVVPTWSHGLYSCRYVYTSGEIALSVKELPNQTATDAYFASLQRFLGERQPWANLGQAAFVTPNGSMVVRKDNKVLFVDISRLPARFGSPPSQRSNAALNVAITIMGCWTGA
jgi:hypothetical protein